MSEQNNNTWTAKANIASAAENGDPRAQIILGWYYYIGHGMTPDKSIAVEWYEKAAAKGLPEAKRLLELVRVKSDKPTITDIVTMGQTTVSRWRSARRVLFLVLTLAIIASIIYYYWPKHQQALVRSENDVIPSDQHMPVENEPNLHVDKSGVSAKDIELVHPVTIKPEADELSASTEATEQETIVDSNSSERDPNSIPIPKSKSVIEELTEIADKWLKESPIEAD